MLTLVSLLFVTSYASAQEGGLILGDPIQEKPKQMNPSNEEGEMGLKEQPVLRSKTSTMEVKSNSTSTPTTQNTSLKEMVKVKKTKPQQENKTEAKEEEESVLTFNFLHYMIQKFKFGEVIDQ